MTTWWQLSCQCCVGNRCLTQRRQSFFCLKRGLTQLRCLTQLLEGCCDACRVGNRVVCQNGCRRDSHHNGTVHNNFVYTLAMMARVCNWYLCQVWLQSGAKCHGSCPGQLLHLLTSTLLPCRSSLSALRAPRALRDQRLRGALLMVVARQLETMWFWTLLVWPPRLPRALR